MSRASVEQALTGLVPALNGPLPPELIDLALSLLARSRSVAQSLKSDEEIGRPYACAQLACERTKKRFNLPTIVSRPPCPPRIYKKLYNYLSSALPASEATREPQTPSKRATAASASARNTPKTPLTGRRTPRSTKKAAAADIPAWVMPAIRKLVKAFEFPNAAPHVFTGLESTMPLLARMSIPVAETPSKRSSRTGATSAPSADLPEARIKGLIAVVFLYIFTRMKNVEVVPEEYQVWRQTALETLLGVPGAEEVTYDDLSLEAEELMPMAKAEGWLNMEWFVNVMPLDDDEDAMDGVEMTEASDKRAMTKAGGSDYIGLGTMMQDATDYLGDRRREDFKIWKAKVMARVQEIEAT
ncbi:hypothetical protein HBH70_147730 [Parastagonospora nodorum]|nr:hypothetical protein HBH53_042460 [Parastagonospora nodorum]KAH3979815.1 hypothetical protein HBH51_053490 [Parastagonospora nodorum]KAH4047423.1 hypothetical protein HBH49_173890 [Parastagonospora nodorum]KAH4076013.1 hypothetical protein HBH50_024590 [Parastagonospora nodorum]KAH4097681.1 hypothetical protein HBH48_022690 [Parastagonospora nodorum]